MKMLKIAAALALLALPALALPALAQMPFKTTPQTNRVVVSAAGASTPIAINGYSPSQFAPALLVNFSSGASATVEVDVTGDPVDGSVTPVWVPFSGMTGLTGSAAATLGALVTGVRLNVTSYTSGTITFEVVQAGPR